MKRWAGILKLQLEVALTKFGGNLWDWIGRQLQHQQLSFIWTKWKFNLFDLFVSWVGGWCRSCNAVIVSFLLGVHPSHNQPILFFSPSFSLVWSWHKNTITGAILEYKLHTCIKLDFHFWNSYLFLYLIYTDYVILYSCW